MEKLTLTYSALDDVLLADIGRTSPVHLVPIDDQVTLYLSQADPTEVVGFQLRDFVHRGAPVHPLRELMGEEILGYVEAMFDTARAMPPVPVPLTEEFLSNKSQGYAELEGVVPEATDMQRRHRINAIRQAGWVLEEEGEQLGLAERLRRTIDAFGELMAGGRVQPVLARAHDIQTATRGDIQFEGDPRGAGLRGVVTRSEAQLEVSLTGIESLTSKRIAIALEAAEGSLVSGVVELEEPGSKVWVATVGWPFEALPKKVHLIALLDK